MNSDTIEKTIDLNDLIEYYPAIAQNNWVVTRPKPDVEIVDFLDAIVSGELMRPVAVGFLLEKTLLPIYLHAGLVWFISCSVPVKKEMGAEYLGLYQAREKQSLCLNDLDTFRDIANSSKAKSPEHLIMYYIADALLQLGLHAAFEQVIGEAEGDKSTPLLSSKLSFQQGAVSAKMAYYHLERLNKKDAIAVLTAWAACVKDELK